MRGKKSKILQFPYIGTLEFTRGMCYHNNNYSDSRGTVPICGKTAFCRGARLLRSWKKGVKRSLKATSEVVLREIAGENLLIPVGQTALKIHGMITLSESGLLLWNRLQEECTEEDLVNALLAEYQVDRETATADVKAFVQQMREVGILV